MRENKDSEPSYQRTILQQSEDFEVVRITWDSNSHAPTHDHGWSQCLVLVEEGHFENTLNMGGKKEVRVYETGQVIDTPVAAQHEIRCLSTHGKTFHVYTPKLAKENVAEKFKISSLPHLRSELTLSEPTYFDPLKKLLKNIQENCISTQSPFFMNQLFSGLMPQMLMAEEVISRTKTTLATQEASPALTAVEAEVVNALGKIIGWEVSSRDGICVPGGSAANFMALHCARQKKFPEIRKTGMPAEKLKIFISAEAHYSFKKACVSLGIGTDQLILVPADPQGKMKAEVLDELVLAHTYSGSTPLIVCATAGTTVLGAFDPIEKISAVCKKHGIWLHVDGAWGGPVIFSEKHRPLVKGIEFADSVTFDAHKLFGANLTCSFFLTRHSHLLLEANDVSGADYLFHDDHENLDRGKMSWQCGRKADALSFWSIWKSLGTAGLGEYVDRLMHVRDQSLAWSLSQPRLQLVAEPEYLNLCFRVKAPETRATQDRDWSRKVREQLKDKNLAMVNYSTDGDGSFLRLILTHPYLEFAHVKQILEWALQAE